MAWEFAALCPACGERWEGISASLHLGPLSIQQASDLRGLFCPYCYLRLHYPRSLERHQWRLWHEQFLRESPFRSEWLLAVLDRIDASLSSASWYVPQAVEIEDIPCPRCQVPMPAWGNETDHVVCPRCGSHEPRLSEFTAHVNMAFDEHGFA